MNYSEMSDHQINVLVAKALDGHADEKFPLQRRLQVFDPCSSWADAGPIIASKLIAIKPVALYVGGHRWFATEGEGDFGPKAADNNPLRAAMIVFLMMQEGK